MVNPYSFYVLQILNNTIFVEMNHDLLFQKQKKRNVAYQLVKLIMSEFIFLRSV